MEHETNADKIVEPFKKIFYVGWAFVALLLAIAAFGIYYYF